MQASRDPLIRDHRASQRKHGQAVEVTGPRGRQRVMWVSMPTPPETRMEAPAPVARFEVRDHAAGLWVAAPQWLARRLRALTPDRLRAVLRSKQFGLRLASGDDAVPIGYGDMPDKLRRMIADGTLHLGGRSYKVSKSPGYTDSYAVTSASGTVRHTFDALLDVLSQGRF